MPSVLDVLNIIPQDIKDRLKDTLVDFLSEYAKKFVGNELSSKIKRLRTDAAFNQGFEAGLSRAFQRFVDEYEEKDEDLVEAILANQNFLGNKEILLSLKAILKQPNSYLIDEIDTVAGSFKQIFPNRKNRQRVNQAVSFFLKCAAEEIWHLPELHPIYSLQFQRTTAEIGQ